MFKLRKITIRFIALAIAFSCLGFTALTVFSGPAYAMKWCRYCVYDAVPGYILYYSWMAPTCPPSPPQGAGYDILTYCPLDVS
jgi:hypothetical protein